MIEGVPAEKVIDDEEIWRRMEEVGDIAGGLTSKLTRVLPDVIRDIINDEKQDERKGDLAGAVVNVMKGVDEFEANLKSRYEMAALTGLLANPSYVLAKKDGFYKESHDVEKAAEAIAEVMMMQRADKRRKGREENPGDRMKGITILERGVLKQPVVIGFDGPNNTRITGRVVGEDGDDLILDCGGCTGLLRKKKWGVE